MLKVCVKKNAGRLPAAFVAALAVALGFLIWGEANPAHAENLCTDKEAAQVAPALRHFFSERGEALKTQVRAGICSGVANPVPMPDQAEFRTWLQSANGGNPVESKEDVLYSCFGRMFIAEIIDLRAEMEVCLGDATCARELCPDLQVEKPGSRTASQPVQSSNGEGDNAGNGAKPGGGQNLADIYDQNAKDLMAIP